MSHFPELDRLDRISRAWPRVFAQPPLGTHPLTIEGTALIVLCQGDDVTERIEGEAEKIVGLLNRVDASAGLTAIEAVSATRTEILLARELHGLKLWLRDFDVGF
jgi:hypothetical protein